MTTKLQPFNLNTAATFSFTGNTSFSGANVSLGSVSNLHIAGGTADYVLKTDGTGNLSWVAQPIQDEIIFYTNLHQPGELQVLEGTTRWYAPYDLEISVIRARLGTAADDTVGLYLKKNGTTQKTITISSSSTQANIADQTLSMSSGDYLTVDVTNVGTTLKGEDLYIQIGYQKL